MIFSIKEKRVRYKVLHGFVEGYDLQKGWVVRMDGGILWFATAAAGAEFMIGDRVQAPENPDEHNKLHISHVKSAG
ncbi:MAG: hypothetical protein AB8B99_00110 [Phormidesmis sp.]